MAETVILNLKLERAARKGGGDRYETQETLCGTLKVEPFHIYLPQTISRIAGIPIGRFGVTVVPKVD